MDEQRSKKFYGRFPPAFAAILALLVAWCMTGCRTLPPLDPIDLSEPGWTVRHGQAVWRARRDAPEISGEILVATHINGRSFVQFTKTPFPLIIAQAASHSWQIEIPAENKRFARAGSPPARVLWFQLAPAITGTALPRRWSWSVSDSGWRLVQDASGESLEGYFNP